jgi:UDP-GlcNAc:undecaprenyl-phosphate GlcNAc-1-phosphate transferase
LSPFIPALTAIAWPFVFGFAASLVLVPLARLLATRLGFVAQPREDRWHRRPVALFGGVGIGLTVLIGLAVFRGVAAIPALAACAGLIFVAGLADDILSLKPSTKLVIQIALASVLLFFRYRLNWTSSLTLDTILTLVWVVGMTNAFNLLDNMDGLCAGIALIVGGALVVGLLPAAPGTEAFYQARYLALLLGATAGFLVFNFHPASIFMGDSGSLLLGMSFAAITLTHGDKIAAKSNPLTIVAVPVLVLLIPIFDTTLVTLSRILSGKAPSEGGRDHSSHRLVAIGLSERSAVALLWLLAATGGALGIAVDFFSLSWSGLFASFFFIAMVIFAVYLSRVRVYEEPEAQAIDRNSLTPLVADFMYKRRVSEVILDLFLVTMAYYAAYRLRFEGLDFSENFSSFYRSLPIVVGAQMTALFGVGIYKGVWRYFGLMDTVVVAKGVFLGTLGAQLAILYLLRFEGYSRTVFVIYAILLSIILTASRASFRLIGEALQRNRKAATRVVIYGAGDGGSLVVRELTKAQDARYKILGFVDDDARKQRMRVQGYPVLGGYGALAGLILGGVIDAVVISARIIDVERLSELEALCNEKGVSLSRLHVGLESLVIGDDVALAREPGSLLRKNVS